MKTIVMTYALMILGSVLMVASCFMITFDQSEAMTMDTTKHALAYAMKQSKLEDAVTPTSLMKHFETYFAKNALTGFKYRLRLIGFVEEPLFASVEVVANHASMQVKVRESMIEEVRE